MLSKADKIRAYALERHVRPWQRSHEQRLAIRASDVVRGTLLHGGAPNVCSALASETLQTEASVVLVRREGPRQSTTITSYCESPPAAFSPQTPCEKNSTIRSSREQTTDHRPGPDHDGEWRTADICLLSCVSAKRPFPARARELYTSPWFEKARFCVEQMGCPWYILSAKYGLLDPDSIIAPYNQTLKTMPANRRRAWARSVVEDLASHIADVSSVTFFAGMAYREFLQPALSERGLSVYVPMEGMRIGQQLSWLTKQARS